MNLREWPHMAAIWTRGALTNSDLFVSGRFWIAVSVILPIMFLTLSYLLWNWLSDSQLGLWTEANVVAFYSWLNASESPSTTIRNVGFVIAGLIALPLTIWRSLVADRQASAAQRQSDTARRQADIAQRQADTSHQSLMNERYQRGAEMLGSDVLSVRLGGIYALRHLAEEYPEQYHVQVMLLFCAFARNPIGDGSHPLTQDVVGEPPHAVPPLREDVQAVMQAVGIRGREQLKLEGKARFLLDLHGADLRSVQLTNANLASATWENWTGISRAGMLTSHGRTDLTNAKLCSARLGIADLPDADLKGACLCDSVLVHTDLSGANLTDANLHRALSWGPVLSGAKFSADGKWPARGITQSDLDSCYADVDNPPNLSGTTDIDTTEPLAWNGKSRDDKG